MLSKVQYLDSGARILTSTSQRALPRNLEYELVKLDLIQMNICSIAICHHQAPLTEYTSLNPIINPHARPMHPSLRYSSSSSSFEQTSTDRTRLMALLETLLGSLPVQDLPDSLEILGLAVLVVEAKKRKNVRCVSRVCVQHAPGSNLLVSVLPSINAQQRSHLSNHGVLVLHQNKQRESASSNPFSNRKIMCSCHVQTYRLSLNPNLARDVMLDQPNPATALHTRQRLIELALKCAEAAPVALDFLGQLAGGRLTTTLALRRQVLPEQRVVDVAAAVEVDGGLEGDFGGDVGFGFGGGVFLDGVVVAVDVGVVVVFVVEFHDLAADGGFEGAVVVWWWLVLDALEEMGASPWLSSWMR